jgi:hypothetical protein
MARRMCEVHVRVGGWGIGSRLMAGMGWRYIQGLATYARKTRVCAGEEGSGISEQACGYQSRVQPRSVHMWANDWFCEPPQDTGLQTH